MCMLAVREKLPVKTDSKAAKAEMAMWSHNKTNIAAKSHSSSSSSHQIPLLSAEQITHEIEISI